MPDRYGLTIRAVEAADAEGLAELLRAGGVDVPRERLAARLAALRQEAGAVFVADAWGPPTGVIALHWSSRLTTELKVAEATLLLVDPERRRSGVARLLLKAASQAARAAGCGELVLGLDAGRDDLQAFALATGFAAVGRRLGRPLRRRD